MGVGTLILTSTAGNGHFQVANNLENKILADKLGPVQIADVMQFLGKMGTHIKNSWSRAQKEGDTQKLIHMVKCQPLGDKLLHYRIKKKTRECLQGYEKKFGAAPRCIINTQVTALSAICSAVKEHYRQRPTALPIAIEMQMTDFPERSLHFFKPIRQLSSVDKKMIKLFTTTLKGKSEQASRAFIMRKTGLAADQIFFQTHAQLPVNPAFKEQKKASRQPFVCPLSHLDDKQTSSALSSVPNLSPYLDLQRQTYQVNPGDKLYSIVLGSQPNRHAIYALITQMIALARQAKDPSQQYHFVIPCGKANPNDPIDPFMQVCQSLVNRSRGGDFPPNLHILPLPFQKVETIAQFMARSDKRIIRSGGSSSFEMAALHHALQEDGSKTFIWSDASQSPTALDYHATHHGQTAQAQLLEEIPLWEKGNAEHLGCRLISNKTFTEEFAEDFYPQVSPQVTGIRKDHVHTIRKLEKALYSQRSRFQRLVDWVLGRDTRRLITIAKLFNKALDQLEEHPIEVAKHGAAKQQLDFKRYLWYANDLLTPLTGKRGRAARQQTLQLARRITALQYRLGAQNGGLDPLPFPQNSPIRREPHLGFLKDAEQWKKKNKVFSDNPALTAFEQEQLKKTFQYHSFTQLLHLDSKFRDEFFDWTLQRHLSPEVFIQYASATQKIPIKLQDKLSKVCPDALKIQVRRGKKELTLPFVQEDSQGRTTIVHAPILPLHNKIAMTPTWRPSVAEIFLSLQKPRAEQQIELMRSGLTHWSPSRYQGEHSAKPTIDFQAKGWWNKLPIYRKLTKAEVEKEYGPIHHPTNWYVSARSVYHLAQLEFDQNHSYLEIVIPQKDGSYHMYPFGLFSFSDPHSMKEKIDFGFASMEGRVIYPDASISHTDRKNRGCSLQIPAQLGEEFMGEIAQDIELGMKGKKIYQLVGENCAKWVEGKIDYLTSKLKVAKLPLMQSSFFKMEPRGVANWFFKGPTWLTKFFFRTIGKAFRPGREFTIDGKPYSVKNSPFWREGLTYHPYQLVKNLKEQRLKSCYHFA